MRKWICIPYAAFKCKKRLFDDTILNGEVFEPLKENSIFQNSIIDHGKQQQAFSNLTSKLQHLLKGENT